MDKHRPDQRPDKPHPESASRPGQTPSGHSDPIDTTIETSDIDRRAAENHLERGRAAAMRRQEGWDAALPDPEQAMETVRRQIIERKQALEAKGAAAASWTERVRNERIQSESVDKGKIR